MSKIDSFRNERSRLNDLVLASAGQELKRFFHLDAQCYQEGILPVTTKEMLGLVASLVLRCDDCICYHLDQCFKAGVTDEELQEVLSIGLIVGGSIVIPHLRRGMEFWKELQSERSNSTGDKKS